MQKDNSTTTQVVIIGAGLTGLTTAYWLSRKGIPVHVVEADTRIGGQIQTNHKNNYIFETGPTTGSVSTPEVAELMNDLAVTSGGSCVLETAPDSSKRRLIWKGDRFHDLPSSPVGGLTTPLFRWTDKLRILGEPWRKKGGDGEIERLVIGYLHEMLKFPAEATPDFIHISRHRHAIPQYDVNSGRRFEAVGQIERISGTGLGRQPA